ncbi:Fibronectin type III domain containing protein 3C1 [Apodemus speciosus]|uniref:Fibronectin type III domain containing protein 3C1 n=1 Tax=Apodemus speciosus TaxID=105296 RepID=A0ABQ0FUY1_APOSI
MDTRVSDSNGARSPAKTLANFINYNLLMEDRSGRFSVIYRGSDVTHKVQEVVNIQSTSLKSRHVMKLAKDQSLTSTLSLQPSPHLHSKCYSISTREDCSDMSNRTQAPKVHPLNNNCCEIKWESLEPIKGDPIVYCLQVTTGKKANQIYKGPNTSFSFSNYHANSRYRFKVCAGRRYETSNGLQELWGPYSPSALFSTYKHHSGHGKGSGGRGKGNHHEKAEKCKTEMSDDTFVLTLLIGFALIAVLCAVAVQYLLIN